MPMTAQIEMPDANMRLQCPECDEWVRLRMENINFNYTDMECWIRIQCPFCKTEVTVYGHG